MKELRIVALWVFIVLFLALTACGGSERNVNMSYGGGSLAFLIDQSGSPSKLPLAAGVEESSSGVVVTVSTSEVTTNEIFFKLNYDASRFNPKNVEFTGAMGKSVDIAITDVPGCVDVGTSRIRNREDAGISVRGDIVRIHFARESCVRRRASQAPLGPENKVNLAAVVVDGQATLSWTEKNCGDYDNNGEVGVSDITPIAINYGVASGQILSLVDGDKNGEIGVSDITPIATHYQNAIAGYRVNVKRGASFVAIPNPVNPGSQWTVDRPTIVPNDRPVTYTFNYTLEPTDEESFNTMPICPNGTVGVASNTTGGGPEPIPIPPKVTGMSAAGDESYGEGVIRLNWDASTDPYLDHYKLWWQEGGDGTQLVACPGFDNISASTTTVDIPDCERGVTYWFAIWACNFNENQIEQHGPLSDIVSAQAWYDVPPIPDFTITGFTRDRTTIMPSETANISVQTSHDGTEFEQYLTFTWTVKSGNGSIIGSSTSRSISAGVTGKTTATFEVTVDDTLHQHTASASIIGTTMAPVGGNFNNSNVFVLGPNWLFTGESYVHGPNHQFAEWADDQKVILLNFWSYW
ncbi:MAG: hypothetical protein HRF49_03465 [bacterium]